VYTHAELIGTSAPIVGRYERGDMMPSVEIATKIAEALNVSLDFLVGNSSLIVKDKNVLQRFEDIAKLPSPKQNELFNVMDAYLRDYRTSKSYSK
jgi:transcriptional regulator with XRE-family HTH domain